MNEMQTGRVKASVEGPGLKNWESSRQPVGRGGRLPKCRTKPSVRHKCSPEPTLMDESCPDEPQRN